MTTLIAAFDQLTDAQAAVSQLQHAGVPDERVHLEPSIDAGFIRRAGPRTPKQGAPGAPALSVGESIGLFFADLVESHTTEWGIYADRLRPGLNLVLVRAVEASEAYRLRSMLQACGGDVHMHEGAAPVAAAAPVPAAASGGGAASQAGTPRAQQGMRGGAPVGTHSFTGGGANVGMPQASPVAGQGGDRAPDSLRRDRGPGREG